MMVLLWTVFVESRAVSILPLAIITCGGNTVGIDLEAFARADFCRILACDGRVVRDHPRSSTTAICSLIQAACRAFSVRGEVRDGIKRSICPVLHPTRGLLACLAVYPHCPQADPSLR